MRVLVTGGLGFIGCNLIHYWLKKYPNHEIINIDSYTYAANEDSLNNLNVKTLNIDIRDEADVEDVIKRGKPELIIHLAACSHVDRSISDPREFVETNVVGTFNLLQAAHKYGVKRFHHVSTDEVYGSLSLTDPAFTELTRYDPSSVYSATKAGSDHLVNAYYHTYGLQTTISNCSNNFGPYQHSEKFIPTVIKNFINGKQVPVYGTGENIRDWIYVQDHAAGIDAVIFQGTAGETYNLGGNLEKTNLEIINDIIGLMEKRNGFKNLSSLIKFVDDRPGHDFRYAIDNTKATSHTSWKPSKNWKENLANTIDWYIMVERML